MASETAAPAGSKNLGALPAVPLTYPPPSNELHLVQEDYNGWSAPPPTLEEQEETTKSCMRQYKTRVPGPEFGTETQYREQVVIANHVKKYMGRTEVRRFNETCCKSAKKVTEDSFVPRLGMTTGTFTFFRHAGRRF